MIVMVMIAAAFRFLTLEICSHHVFGVFRSLEMRFLMFKCSLLAILPLEIGFLM